MPKHFMSWPFFIDRLINRNNENLVLPPEAQAKRSYFCNIGTSPLLGLTIGDLLEYSCCKYANNEFMVVPFQGIRRTFRQLKDEVIMLQNG